MSIDNRVPIKSNSAICLTGNIGGQIIEKTFNILDCIGRGSSCMVYTAEYKSGGISHKCLLKELYPSDCGLVRSNFIDLVHQNGKPSQDYEQIEKKFIEGYDIQVTMYNGNDIDGIGNFMTAPLNIYRNKSGIIYTEYNFAVGMTYDNKKNESLRDIIHVISDTAFFISKLHSHGYLMLDIKESNILLLEANNRIIVHMFDFGYFVKKEELKKYVFDINDTILEFTKSDKYLTLPYELQEISHNIKKAETNPKYKYTIENTVRNRIAKDGERTDLALLAAVFYHRIFGIPAPVIDSPEDFRLPEGVVRTDAVRDKLTKIFAKSLCKKQRNRYQGSEHPMEDLRNDLEDIYCLSIAEDKETISSLKNSGINITVLNLDKSIVRNCSNEHLRKLKMPNCKFYDISHARSFYVNSICRINDGISGSIADTIEKSPFILIQGDGGIGKSSLIYDCWQNYSKDKICLYVELVSYSAVSIGEQLSAAGSENMPTGLLSFIVKNIIKEYNNEYRNITENEISILINQLDAILSENTSGKREFMLFFDGLNELLDPNAAEAFIKDVKLASKRWHNASITITTRRNDNSITSAFERYEITGLSDSEITAQLNRTGLFSDEHRKLLKSKKIWELLKLPMFLDKYISIILHSPNSDNTVFEDMTRGKLLARYIDTIDCPEGNTPRLKKFAVMCVLPFIANKMESRSESLLKISEFEELIRSAVSFFCFNNEHLSSYTIFIDNDSKYISSDLSNDTGKKYMYTIIECIKSTGHCIYAENGRKIGFSHQYLREFFTAKHICNLLDIARSISSSNDRKERKRLRRFVLENDENNINYLWNDSVCTLFGEIERYSSPQNPD